MASDTLMEFLSSKLKMVAKLKFLTIGLTKEIHGKSKELMFNTLLGSTEMSKLSGITEKKKKFGKEEK